MFDLFRSRDKAVRILLGAILMVVALSMVTYLIPGGGIGASASTDQVLAKVGSNEISSRQASMVLQSVLRARQVPAQLLNMYVPQVIQSMINDRAMAYEARRLGIQASEADTATAVQSSLPPQLFKDGKLVSKDAYAAVLAEQNLTIGEFESDMARQVLVNRLRQIVGEGAVVTPQEVEGEFRHRTEKAKIEYVMISPAKLQSELQVAPAEMQAYYDKNRAAFHTMEKKSLAVLVFDPAKIEASINPTEAELRKLYSINVDQFRTPDRVKVRHILLKTDAAKNNDAQVKTKADDLYKQLQGVGDFAELAKKNSEDPGSAAKGGDLGWIARGQTVKNFENTAFSIKPNEISKPIKTEYGYHIIEVMEKEQARTKPFEEASNDIAAQFRKQRVNDQMQTLADKAAAELRKDPQHPEKAAADVNVPLLKADDLVAGEPVPGIGVSKEFDQAIAGLKKGEVSQPVIVGGNKIALAVVTNVNPVHPANFADVQADIRNTLTKNKMEQVLAQKANQLISKTKELNGDLGKAAKELGLEAKESADFDRSGAIEGLGSAGLFPEAFAKPAGSVFGPVTAQGGRVVAKVLSQAQPDMGAFAAQRDSIRDELKQKKARERIDVFQETLRERLTKEGKIKIHQDAIDRLVNTYQQS